MRILSLILFLLSIAGPAWSEEGVHFPDNVRGTVAREFLESYHAGPDAIRAFTLAHRSAEALERSDVDGRVARYEALRATLGELDLLQVTETPEGIRMVAFASTMQTWVRIDLAFEGDKMAEMMLQPTGPPRDEPYIGEWTSLEDLLQQAVASAGVPGMVAAVLAQGQIAEVAVAGVRTVGETDPVQLGDRFHLGSVTKSITATAIASLIQDGTLRWDLTVGEALASVPMLDAYRPVTLRQLLDHVGGIPPYTNITAADEELFGGLPGVGGQQRAGFLKHVLMQEPVATPGTEMVYSNAGYTLAGHIAERKARRSWEKLLQERVFDPLGLASADFGWPHRQDRLESVRGHFGAPPNLRVRQLGEYELGDYLDPAGDVSMSGPDLARYALEHLRGLRGEDGILSAQTLQTLHTSASSDGQGYAGGWVLDTTSDGLTRHWHNGSTGTYLSMVQLVPERNWGFVVIMNAASPADVIDAIAEALYQRELE